jgi:hypothetical protein
MQNGGQCAELWNEPSQSYYYSIQYEGAVFCDPPGGEGRGFHPVAVQTLISSWRLVRTPLALGSGWCHMLA